jgi:hypothetical protein
MASAFPKLFKQYYAIHETIHGILHETNGAEPELAEIERRVREKHPELEMEPATLAAPIQQAIKDANVIAAVT